MPALSNQCNEKVAAARADDDERARSHAVASVASRNELTRRQVKGSKPEGDPMSIFKGLGVAIGSSERVLLREIAGDGPPPGQGLGLGVYWGGSMACDLRGRARGCKRPAVVAGCSVARPGGEDAAGRGGER